MAISQNIKVVPPIQQDPQLVDFANSIQVNLQALFQAGHVHVGKQGVLAAAPTSHMGGVGDILIGVVGGSAYIYFKTDSKTWYRLGPATKV